MLTGDNDNFRFSFNQRLINLTGQFNQLGSTITRVAGDGHETLFIFDTNRNVYVSAEGSGAHDTLSYNIATAVWTWTEGSSQQQEVYRLHQGIYKLAGKIDPEGFSTAFLYDANGLVSQIIDHAAMNADGTAIGNSYVNSGLSQTITLTYDDIKTKQLKSIHSYTPNGYEVSNQSLVEYEYDDEDRLLHVHVDLTPEISSDSKVYTTTYGYDGTSKRIKSISQSDGTVVIFAYEAMTNRISKVTRGSGGDKRITEYKYYDDENRTDIIQITDPDNHTGYISTVIYDGRGRLLQVVTPPNQSGLRLATSYSYDYAGNMLSSKDSRGNVTTFGYDDRGNQTRITDAQDNVITRQYTDDNQLAIEKMQVTDNNGQTQTLITRYVYDTEQRLRFVLDSQGNLIETRYLGSDKILTLQFVDDQYDDVQDLADDVFPSEQTLKAWVSGLDNDPSNPPVINRTETLLDFRGQIRQVTRFQQGNLADNQTADDNDSSSYFIYDQYGQLLKTIGARGDKPVAGAAIDKNYDAGNFETTYVYDGLGRVTKTVSEAGTVQTLYNPPPPDTVGNQQQQIQIIDVDGSEAISIYNTAGELVEVHSLEYNTTSALNKTQYHYDELGRLRATEQAGGLLNHQLIDRSGRLIAVVDSLGYMTENRYDETGNLVQTIAYANALSAAIFSELSSQVTTGSFDETDPVTILSSWLTSVGNSADDRMAFFLYNDLNQLRFGVDVDGYVTETRYDEAGQVLQTLQHSTRLSTTEIDQLDARFITATYVNNGSSDPFQPFGQLQNTATNNLLTYVIAGVSGPIAPPPLTFPYAPVTHFDFSEGSGSSTTDKATNTSVALQGSMFDITGWVDGIDGQALKFDGINDEITFTEPTVNGGQRLASQPFTAQVWINVADLSAANQWFGMGFLRSLSVNGETGDYYVGVDNDGAVRFAHWTADGVNTNNHYATLDGRITENQWHHIAVVWDGVNHKIYVDGADQTLITSYATGGWLPGTGLGKLYGDSGGQNNYKGQLDEVVLFDKSLSTAQISDLYEFYAADIIPTPITHYRMNENTGSVLTDASPNLNNATLVNMEAGDRVSGMEGSALDFDGTDDQVTFVDPQVDGTRLGVSPFAVQSWINVDDLAAANPYYGMGIIRSLSTTAQNGDYYVAVDNDGALHFAHWTNDGDNTDDRYVTADGVITQNQWHHIVVVWDGNAHKVYVDGVDQALTVAFSADGWEAGEGIGRIHASETSNTFHGKIDEVALFNQRLSQNQVNVLFHQFPTPTAKQAYSFSEGSGITTSETLSGSVLNLQGTDLPNTGWVEAVNGKGLQFNGVNDHIDIPDPVVSNGPFTVETWVNVDDLSSANNVYGMGIVSSLNGGNKDDFIVSVDNDGAVHFTHWQADGWQANDRHYSGRCDQ